MTESGFRVGAKRMSNQHSRLRDEDISVRGAENLAHGIVQRAALDYARELRISWKTGERTYELAKLEHFFNSDWGHWLCGGQSVAEYIAKKIREDPHIRRSDFNNSHQK